MQANGNIVIPSLTGSIHFCLLPDGTGALNYHTKSNTIVWYNFGKESSKISATGITLSDFKIIRGVVNWNGRGAVNWNGMCVIQSESNTYVIGLIEESLTNMFYLVSFRADFSTKSWKLQHELFFGVHKIKSNCWAEFQRDENGSHFCIAYWWTGENAQAKTVFTVNKVLVDETGYMQAQMCSYNDTVNGLWLHPFIFNNYIYFQPLNPNDLFMLKSPLKTTAPSTMTALVSQFKVVPQQVKKSEKHGVPPTGIWVSPDIFDGKVYYYIYRTIKKKDHGEIWSLTIADLKWEKHGDDFTLHAVGGQYATIRISKNGTFYLNGDCCETACVSRSHIHVIAGISVAHKPPPPPPPRLLATKFEDQPASNAPVIKPKDLSIRPLSTSDEPPPLPPRLRATKVEEQPAYFSIRSLSTSDVPPPPPPRLRATKVEEQPAYFSIRSLSTSDVPPPPPPRLRATKVAEQPAYAPVVKPKDFSTRPISTSDDVVSLRSLDSGRLQVRPLTQVGRNGKDNILRFDTSSFASQKCSSKDYVLDEKLGEGNFGKVFKCIETESLKVFVAKKMILSETSFEVAQQEVNILQQLQHPKVVEYYECFFEDNSILIIMEYMAGGSLKQMMGKCGGHILEKTAINYTEQVLEGLAFIHSKENGIVHCDLKCENLLLDGKGGIKLGDFGIAVRKVISTINQSLFTHPPYKGGTFHWMAPELLDDTKTFGRPVDMWSLGCTIVEMLTGQPPYSELTTLNFLVSLGSKQLSYNPYQIVPSNISADLKTFLSLLLIFEPNARPKSGSDALEEFRLIFKL